MNKVRKGTVLKLDSEANEEFIVVDNVEKDGKLYAVLAPFELEEGKDTVEIDYKKLILIELKDDGEYDYVTDSNLIKELVEMMLKK